MYKLVLCKTLFLKNCANASHAIKTVHTSASQ